MTTLAVRNANPLNIRTGKTPWHGQTGAHEGFVVFENPQWGFRAAAKILTSYLARGFNTVEQIVDRWAPPTENNDAAYLADVVKHSNLQPGQTVFKEDYFDLIKAMAIHESGAWDFIDADLTAGLAIA